ncbi:hypothetical protein IEQ34_000308 [Dendrobium chrysotoxum]|uniref:DUF4378 domain-containing protein n=1 Tax=Dendrobium chrysotoxum TaxID=161865 RepID=A0AAV7HTM5_DENCH|nr:hypothetical protein IEQ34_000308 [Dendrobium chrysotoxum]
MRLSSSNRGRSTPTVFFFFFVSKSSSKENLKSKRGGLSRDPRFCHPNLPLPFLSNEENYGRPFPGCMKGLVHFLNLHHHLHLRKMKLLTYRKHGEGKRAARNKEPKIDPDAPSTSQQYVCTEDACLGVEDQASTRKQPVKSSMRISIAKWKSREHNKKRKASLPAPRLLRTSSIHHWSEDHVDNVNFGLEISFIKQNVDLNKASSSSEQACCFDEHNFEKQCDENIAYCKNGPFGPRKPDELESILQIKQLHLSNTQNEAEVGSFAQQHTNVKELQGDVILYPSKEFLAMMKLFNGNIELIRNILDDPSFIFAHYLQAKQASKAELTRAYSFPSSPLLVRKIDGQFGINHKNFESESLAKQSYKFHSENSRAYTDIIQDDTTNAEMNDGDEERNPKLVETNNHSAVLASSSILQNVRSNPPNSNRFMAIKHNKKEHHRIFMDGILHKMPFGRRVIESMKKSKFGWWDGLTIEKPDGEGLMHACWNKINKNVKKNIHRSQSLNDSLDKYSHLYDSISKEEFERLPERRKVKPLGRVFSLPDITYCSSSKHAQSEAPFSSPKNLTTSHTEEILEKEESEEFTTHDSSKWIVADCWKIPLQSNEKEQSESCQILKKLTKDGLIREENSSVTPQGENLLDEAQTYEPTKPTLVSATGALARGLEHRYPSEHSSLFDNNAADGLVDTNEIDLTKAKPFPDIDCFDSLHLRIDQKYKATFNYVRETLKRSGFSGSGFLGAWNSPYQPMDPLIFNEGEDLSHELDITEDEHDILLEHQLLFDLINEAWVKMYEKYCGYFFPWLSRFNTNNKPMPMGDHILKERWTNICWHLKGQPEPDINLEDIVSRNFTKNDGWMNIQYDIEDVELDLECLILDALLDDFVLQLSLLLYSNPISC